MLSIEDMRQGGTCVPRMPGGQESGLRHTRAAMGETR